MEKREGERFTNNVMADDTVFTRSDPYLVPIP